MDDIPTVRFLDDQPLSGQGYRDPMAAFFKGRQCLCLDVTTNGSYPTYTYGYVTARDAYGCLVEDSPSLGMGRFIPWIHILEIRPE